MIQVSINWLRRCFFKKKKSVMVNEIEGLRAQIDAVDHIIFQALKSRSELVKALGELKQILNFPTRDEKREQAIIHRLCQGNTSFYTDEELSDIYETIFKASLGVQSRVL